MGLSTRKENELKSVRLIPSGYKKYLSLWQELAVKADKAAREMGAIPTPLEEDAAEYLVVALRVRPEFQDCMDNSRARGQLKYYSYFADYILHNNWEKVRSSRPK